MDKEWTESEENELIREQRERQLKMIRDIQNKAEKKYNNLEANYNDTGSENTYRSMHYYDNLIKICQLAADAIKGNCSRCEAHKNTAEMFVKKYQDAKTLNMTDVLNFDSIISDFIQCKFY